MNPARLPVSILGLVLLAIPACNDAKRDADPGTAQGGDFAGTAAGPAAVDPKLDDLGDPSDQVQALWAAATGDSERLAEAVNGLANWFEHDGKHLLDRDLDYSFIESLALDDLRAADLASLPAAGWDPATALGVNEAELEARLEARAAMTLCGGARDPAHALEPRAHGRREGDVAQMQHARDHIQKARLLLLADADGLGEVDAPQDARDHHTSHHSQHG